MIKYKSHLERFVLIFVTFTYGLTIQVHFEIMGQYKLYKYLINYDSIDFKYIGMWFMTLALLKFVGIIVHSRLVRRVALSLIASFWTMYTIIFRLSAVPNTIWLFGFVMLCLCFSVAQEE